VRTTTSLAMSERSSSPPSPPGLSRSAQPAAIREASAAAMAQLADREFSMPTTLGVAAAPANR
jgi:hypothetical protein